MYRGNTHGTLNSMPNPRRPRHCRIRHVPLLNINMQPTSRNYDSPSSDDTVESVLNDHIKLLQDFRFEFE